MATLVSTPYLSVELARPDPDRVVATLIGELDISNCTLLDAVLLPLSGQDLRDVIVCAERLSFCDVVGFRVLKSLDLIMRATGTRMSIVAPSPQFRRLTALLESSLMSPWPAMQQYASLAEAWQVGLAGQTGEPD